MAVRGGELAPTPAGYDTLTRRVAQETCSALEDHSSRLCCDFVWGEMYREDLLIVFFCYLLLATGRSKELWERCHGVVDPLSPVPNEERAVMTVCVESN